MLISTPEVIGQREIPSTLRCFQSFSKDVISLLPELCQGKALVLKFNDEAELRIGRKQILTAGLREYGAGRVQTGSESEFLYVWLRDHESNSLDEMRAQVKGVSND